MPFLFSERICLSVRQPITPKVIPIATEMAKKEINIGRSIKYGCFVSPSDSFEIRASLHVDITSRTATMSQKIPWPSKTLCSLGKLSLGT